MHSRMLYSYILALVDEVSICGNETGCNLSITASIIIATVLVQTVSVQSVRLFWIVDL